MSPVGKAVVEVKAVVHRINLVIDEMDVGQGYHNPVLLGQSPSVFSVLPGTFTSGRAVDLVDQKTRLDGGPVSALDTLTLIRTYLTVLTSEAFIFILLMATATLVVRWSLERHKCLSPSKPSPPT